MNTFEVINGQTSFYFGRAIGYVLAMVHPDVRIDLTYEEVYATLVREEEELRKSEHIFDMYKVLYKSNSAYYWEKYFKGIKKGFSDMLKTRGLLLDSYHRVKLLKSGKCLSILPRVLKFYENRKEESIKIKKFDSYKNKLFIAQFNLVFKMSKIKNPIYMQGIAEDIAKKIAKDVEITSKIGTIMSDFCNYISNFTFKVSGVNDVPELVIGALPGSDENEEYIDEEILSKANSENLYTTYLKKGIDLKKMKEELLFSNNYIRVSNKKNEENEEDEENEDDEDDEELEFEDDKED